MTTFRTYELSLTFQAECSRLRFTGAYRDQFERASLSIVINLAEGAAKPTVRDRRKFYYIALGSLREVQALLRLAAVKGLKCDAQVKRADELGAYLYKLCKSVV